MEPFNVLISPRSCDDCKRRWRNIKDTYFRNRKKRKLGTGSAASERVIKWTLYDRLSFLDVIKHERESKNTLTEEEETPAYSETDYETQPTDESTLDDSDLLDEYSTPSTSRRISDAMKLNKGLNKNPFQQNCGKRSQPRVSKLNTMAQFEERAQKRMELLETIHKKNISNSEDDVDLFMKSISFTVKKFPPAELNEAKLGILKLVSDLQLKLATQNSSQQTPAHSSQPTSPADRSNSHSLGTNQYQLNGPFNLTETTSHTTASTSQYKLQNGSFHLAATESDNIAGSYFKSYNPEQQNSSISNVS
ncbi:unnamed protein product [Acanthoscelides obtectus]|uniref:BESS domain-containing protein n=1 Tax=Acanthoscelides obtectus TaxID=200917 RepID=A0A9P0JMM9_ACAOB|nr:unnamed protein product [Acanthoscelides obtectus]CAK1661309.1 hypothetical protein AOBTE_LOCUS22562 [Acanthoscelides obtectus]